MKDEGRAPRAADPTPAHQPRSAPAPQPAVLVIGAGALGSLLGGRLADAGRRVTLFTRRAEHVAAIRERGLAIEERDGRVTTRRLAATADATEAGGADLAVVTVKAHDTRAALEPFRGRLGAEGTVLSLQNGLGNDAAIRAALGPDIRLILGATASGATLLGPGRVRDGGAGPTTIGYPGRAPDARLARVAATLGAAGWAATTAARIADALWAKLLVNAAINPLAALTGLPNGVLPARPDLAELMRAVLAEAAAVARAEGAAAGTETGDEAFARVRAVCAATAVNRSSMLQDLDAGRRTEIGAINGAIAALGARHGLATPLNAALVALVRGREAARGVREEPPGEARPAGRTGE